MKITIHRGTNEIGGTCVELNAGKTRLLLDLGMPLGNFSKEGVNSLPDTLDGFDAVLISHPHQDHYGLIEHISPEIPVYAGELGQKFIQAMRLFTGAAPLKNNFKSFEAWTRFSIGDFQITPYLIDHSAADAYAFLIEGCGKKIFYSGDFRAHGRKSKLYKQLVQKPPANIDVLLMEGTMLGRKNIEFPTESSVEDAMLAHLKAEKGASFLISSSQNIDRMVTAYRASKRAGRIFVVDIYTAWILKEISNFSKRIPTIEWIDVRVLSKGRTAASHYRTIKTTPDYFEGFVRPLYEKNNIIEHDAIRNEPQKYFIKTPRIRDVIDSCGLNKAGIVYSQWDGYMQEKYNPKRYQSYKELEEDPSINFIRAHTSGHAVLDDLKLLAAAIAPKMLVPVHTEHKERYGDFFDNVKILEDGETFNL